MEFSEYEIKTILKELKRRILLLEAQPERNAKRIKLLKNTQNELYKRLEKLKGR